MTETKNINEINEQLTEIRPHPIDESYTKPAQGGCWICRRGNGWEETDEFKFIAEIDAFYHPPCLEKLDLDDEKDLAMLVKDIKKNRML